MPPSRSVHPAAGSEAHEVSDIENQRHSAVAENGRTGEGFDVGVKLGQRLDHGLAVADHLVDHQAHAGFAGRYDHHLLVGFDLRSGLEQFAQAQERHQAAADVEEVAAAIGGHRVPRQLDAFLDGRKRNRVTAAADAHQHALDDRERERQPQRDRRTRARFRIEVDAAAQALDRALDHVHADAAA